MVAWSVILCAVIMPLIGLYGGFRAVCYGLSPWGYNCHCRGLIGVCMGVCLGYGVCVPFAVVVINGVGSALSSVGLPFVPWVLNGDGDMYMIGGCCRV